MPSLKERMPRVLEFENSVPLIAYHQKSKIAQKSTMYNDLEMVTNSDEEDDENADKTYYPYLKQLLNLHVVCDTSVYESKASFPPNVYHLLKPGVDRYLGLYRPIVYLSDFWVLMRDLIIIDAESIERIKKVRSGEKQIGTEEMSDKEIENLNFNGKVLLTWDNFNMRYVGYQQQFLLSLAQQETMGLLRPSDYDEFKRIWLETDPILFSVTAIVSVLHLLFEALAFKNDIQFWSGKDNVEGISVKTLYSNIIMNFVITLFLLDNDTSIVILAPQVISTLIEVWKLMQASHLEKSQQFPYFKLVDKASYAESETKRLDEDAMKYMSYALYPLLLAYTGYSLVNYQPKSWYSFTLSTAVGAIYVYGFILMTPQLYINYKLQSVEHMPQRVLFYRFLNTIIDDLFSFIITMPTMHRISCFRDDLIFVIYLYQRYAYRVDKTRGVNSSGEAIISAVKLSEVVPEGQEVERTATSSTTTSDSQAGAETKKD